MNPGMKWGAVLLAGWFLPALPFLILSIKDRCKHSQAANAFWQWTSRFGKMRGLIWRFAPVQRPAGSPLRAHGRTRQP